MQARLMRVGTFAHLRNAQDGTDPQYQAATAKVSALHARVDASTSFVDSEILALPTACCSSSWPPSRGWPTSRHAGRPAGNCARTGWAPRPSVLASLGEVLDAPA
jgi:hypothetical protein